jgi:O-succinylbenzoic acid--CoA ligase
LSYAGLSDRIGSLAAYYQDRGVKPGRALAVVSQDAECIAAAVYLSLYTGSILVPLDPHRERAIALMIELGIKQVLVDSEVDLGLPSDVRTLPAASLLEEASTPCLPSTPMSSDETQLIISTSGAGGTAKGVMLSGRNLAASVEASRQRLGLEPGNVWLVCLPLFHIGGLAIVLRCLQAGAAMLVHQGFEPPRVWQDLNGHPVTHVSLVPAMLSRLLDHCADSRPPAHLRVVLVGGGVLSTTLALRAVRAGWPICPTYGMSETASQVATLCRITEDWRSGDVGRPLQGMHVEIVDEQGRSTRGNGRIRISGPCVMRGYASLGGVSGVGLDRGAFKSNDLGYVDQRGHLHILGRADEMLVCGGENIFPQEVESRLIRCPGVEQVAVSALHDAAWGHRLVALVVGTAAESALRDWCETHLPGLLRPREIFKVRSLPVNSMGKIDRRLLRDLVLKACE